MAILALSRAIGLLREFLITLAFGFTKLTDLFFQVTFAPIYLLNIITGPFTTALLASLNRAPLAERAGHLRRYRRRFVYAGLAIAPVFLVGGLLAALTFGIRDSGAIMLMCAIVAPACSALLVVGYIAAAANACGMIARANALTTIFNLGFVLGVLLIWLSGVKGQNWLLPAAFTLSALIAAGIAWRWMDQIIQEMEVHPPAGAVAAIPSARLEGLRRGFYLALGESAAFIATQVLVLAMASHVAVGWASAATIAQRIAFSAVVLVVMPVANLTTVAAMNDAPHAHRIFGTTTLRIFVGSSIFAAAAYVLSAPLEAMLGSGWGGFDQRSIHLLMALLPPFSLWLVAMAMSTPAARMMFGMGLGKVYTLVTLAGYALANLARFAAFLQHDFPLAIALGAVVELVVATGLCVFAHRELRRRGGAAFSTPEIIDLDALPAQLSAASAGPAANNDGR